MSLPPDLVEMLSVFADCGVRYLVIGGYAVSLHSRPRSTKDLDLWLDPARDNIERTCEALGRFGVPPEIVAELRVARSDEIVWMGRVPARIDFLQSIPGVEFEAAWGRRTTAEIEGAVVTFIGREDLIANKRAVGRPQDVRDVRALERDAAPRKPARRPASPRKPRKAK
jgi:hypothetical protein